MTVFIDKLFHTAKVSILAFASGLSGLGMMNLQEIKNKAAAFLDKKATQSNIGKALGDFVKAIQKQMKSKGIPIPNNPLTESETTIIADEKLHELGANKRLRKYLFAKTTTWNEDIRDRTSRNSNQNAVIDDFMEYNNDANIFFKKMFETEKESMSFAATEKHTEAQPIKDTTAPNIITIINALNKCG